MLGEMIVYIWSQQRLLTEATTSWTVPSLAVALLHRCLQSEADEICVHYAVKTLENAIALGGRWSQPLLTLEAFRALWALVKGHGPAGLLPSQNLRTTAANTLQQWLALAHAQAGNGGLRGGLLYTTL